MLDWHYVGQAKNADADAIHLIRTAKLIRAELFQISFQFNGSLSSSPLSRRLSRPPAAICAKPVSRPQTFWLSRELAEKNIRLSRRENCGLNTKSPLLKFSASSS